ncbi:MAG: undecaprenyl-phosphate glucose phosphotransferase, partial [Rhodovibrionaceae bacterium]
LGAMLALRGAVHLLAARWARQGRLGRRIAILGDPSQTGRLARHFTAHPDRGIQVAGIFADSHGAQAQRSGVDGGIEALIARLRAEPIDSVILAPSERGEAYLRDLRQQLSEVPVNVWLCPGGQVLNLHDAEVSHFAGIPAFNVIERPIGNWRWAVKEIEDRVIAGIITLTISPLLLGIALAIKFDSPGPLLFRQKRRGFNNEIIEVLKFRTMSVEKTDNDGERLTQRDDPRITRVGAFLRRWSLDELPQFFNVLRGDMSIVGPRPHALRAKAAGQYYFDAVPFYDARHRVKPGITGLAQISGWRGPTETVTQIQKRVEHDIYYIEHWSLWLDLKIILLTAFKGFKSENAF